MTGLDMWLRQATRNLAKDSSVQVRIEIQEHYESARDVALAGGASADEADRRALNALGDAKTANRQYREVLLTAEEARMLRNGNWEARAVCSRGWLKWSLIAVPAAAAALFISGHAAVARDLLIGALGMSPFFAALFLPIYTPARGRIFRVGKWVAVTGALLLLYGPDAPKWSWLWITSLWLLAWTDWTRASIRRKLPVGAWPKHLYL